MTQEQNSEGRASLAGIVNGVILLLILLIVGLVPIRAGLGGFGPGHGAVSGSGSPHAAVPALAPAQGASSAQATAGVAAPVSAAEIASGASISTGPGVVTFYFATGSADLAPDAQQALADIVRGVAAGQRAIVSGYHDATGDPAANETLARQRAQAVQEALESLGIGDDKIELRKPQVTTGSGSDGQARRVEVTLQ